MEDNGVISFTDMFLLLQYICLILGFSEISKSTVLICREILHFFSHVVGQDVFKIINSKLYVLSYTHCLVKCECLRNLKKKWIASLYNYLNDCS